MPIFPSRMNAVQSPIIPTVGQWVRDRPGTISLGQGGVFYAPPPAAIASLTAAMQGEALHQYHAVQGIAPLLSILGEKLAVENQTILGKERSLFVTAGSNMAFMHAILAITQAGDEIILNLPYYFNHEMAIRMAGCLPVGVATDAHYQLDLDAIAWAITPKTRAIVTVSPNNPTGVVYGEDSLRAVNQLCRDRGIYHISDETYEYFTYDPHQHFSPNAIAQSHDYTIALYSLSKAYGFAGWRIGYMVFPAHLLDSIRKIQDTILICPPLASQYAALGAVKTGIAYSQSFLPQLDGVRQALTKDLRSLGAICQVSPSQGAFYLFLNLATELCDLDLVKRLIDDFGVALLPGRTFGMDSGCYLRVAYGAMEIETAREGSQRLVRGLQILLSQER